MKRFFMACAVLCLVASPSFAADRAKVVDRLQKAGGIVDEIMSAPDKGIPEEVLSGARCVAIVPSMLKAGFVLGGEYGQGVSSCRTGHGWSAPAFFRLAGGSFGFQIGGEGIDLVMLIMDDKGMQHLLASKFNIGADASAAAGPVGRHAQAGTDWKLDSEILTYSRAKGVFAGVSLTGNAITQNSDDTRDFYGRNVPFRTILTGQISSPADAAPFTGQVAKYFVKAKEK